MTQSKQRILFVLLVGLLATLISLSFAPLASKVRFGLEFRGGYEIYYVVTPQPGKQTLSKQDVLNTVDILRQRADSIGMSEPDIRLEGEDHIRVKLAGLTSADESRSLLGDTHGLPTVLTEKYTQTVGSVLGKTALTETMTAGVIGIACIFLLLLVLYRGAGLIAAFCTVVYLWLLIILFNASHATLSLSAVVAFVLGIGMAADASIICFERTREQLARGHDLRTAVVIGFNGSFPTIRDANLVTALAMIALFAAGIGPVQGFSLTLLASIVISICTNYFLVRTLTLWLVDSGWLPRTWLIGSGKPRNARKHFFGFVKFGKTAILLSVLTIASGALYYRAHGLNLDIDFTSGTALDIDIDRPTTQSDATQIMTAAGIVPATLAVGGAQNEHIAARFDEVLKPAELKQVISAFQAKYQKVEYEENTADPGIARDFATRAIYAVLAAFISITLYIGLRFSWAIAVATVLPIILDLLFVSAVFALFKFEIDVTYVAALLTIIGYSLNDKIVIFGRIVENLKRTNTPDEASLLSMVNQSIEQTLGRSLYTVLTVVMASTSLYLFACEPLQMFSLALVIGLMCGAVSSIFISSALWATLHSRSLSRPDRRSTIPRLTSRPFISLLLAVAVIGLGGWFWIPTLTPQASPSAQTLVTTGSLGDLSSFSAIASDILAKVKAGDIAGGKARIKDLESAWDASAKQLQARSQEGWTSVDKSIDRALVQLRSGTPDKAAIDESLQTLIAKFASQQGQVAARVSTAGGPLGDLSAYRKIVLDTSALVDAGDMSAARSRITDLETAWDQGEEKLQPMSPSDWTAVDKSIDRALSQLRSGSPDPKACASALTTLLAKIDSKTTH
ncbi:protein translocase subunit SecF [Pseudomonas sp. MH9.2]|uniref:protein translocase subunit SecF n=1 Tax=unclassified Pseudomonas TaxID=196821 RepID=UPI002AC89CEA|nr:MULTISPECIES: protein translocase subunit SecF [unclassified Pseudomonas]MEB0024196.1 protein translocase subunit SecF [Pseudomonas sp. MH9.2]MEB0149659.1 protein translocase subunit SecF [Pseudomonas sp. CCC2.2]MEE3509273.1 protein translocase subunit SecF [Pseudomonas sp. 10C3]WPX67899.1 protein translocase subunit SecF [Pseudomonas sp. MH9.2]